MLKIQSLEDYQESFTDDDLRAALHQLESIAHLTSRYPMQCSVGGFDMLFDSRTEIDVIIEDLADQLMASRKAA